VIPRGAFSILKHPYGLDGMMPNLAFEGTLGERDSSCPRRASRPSTLR
jgi:hypothetical protein